MTLSVSVWPREMLCRLLNGESRALSLVRREVRLIYELIIVRLPLLGNGEGIVAGLAKALIDKARALTWVLALLGVMRETPLLVVVTSCHNNKPSSGCRLPERRLARVLTRRAIT